MRPPAPAAAASPGCANGCLTGLSDSSISLARQLDITILEAQLVRIFDSMKVNQDVFVQLVCGYEDGSEKVVGRTPVHKGGNLTPKWNQTFNTRRGGGKTLKFKVFIDHLFRNPVLCGEAEFDLDTLWTRSSNAGSGMRVPVTLFKRGEQTGVLHIGLMMQAAEAQGAPAPPTPQAAAQRPAMQPAALGAAAAAPAAPAANGGLRRAGTKGDAAWGAPYPGVGAGGNEAALAPAGYPGAPAPAAAAVRGPQPGGPLAQALGPVAAGGLAGRQDGRAGLMPPQDAGGGRAGLAPQQMQQLAQPQQQAQRPQLQPAQPQQQLLPVPQQGCGGALPPPSTGGNQLPTQQSVYATGMSGQWWNSFIDRG